MAATVLLACGAFSPPSYMHLRMLEVARNNIAPSGDAIAAYLSPVSDAYQKGDLLPKEHRIAMCQVATADSSWIAVDPWEAGQPGWTRTVQVLDGLRARLPSGSRIRLVVGSDLALSMDTPGLWQPEDLHRIFTEYGLVVVCRGTKLPNAIKGHDVLVCQAEGHNNLSSTLIRQLRRQGKSIKYLLPDAVIEYMDRHRLYQ